MSAPERRRLVSFRSLTSEMQKYGNLASAIDL
jgi:hypothetical protein